MRRGTTAKHIFVLPFENFDPKALQITYKQGNRIVLQKQLEETEVYVFLYKNMYIDGEGHIIIGDEGFDISIINSPTAVAISKDIIIDGDYMYHTSKTGLRPATGILVDLAQHETLQFNPIDKVTLQVRIVTEDSDSLVSTVTKFEIEDCLDENLLPKDEYTPF